MNQEEAIKVLVQVAALAQSRGILTLEDAAVVNNAVKIFQVKTEEVKTEEKE